jgi:hypothetical protein
MKIGPRSCWTGTADRPDKAGKLPTATMSSLYEYDGTDGY